MGKKKPSSKRWIRLFLYLVVVIVIAVYATLSAVSFDITERMEDLVKSARPNLYGNLTMSRATITILPRPKLRLENASLTTESNDFITARTVKANFLFLPLISKKYRINELVFEDSDITIKRRADGLYNFQRIIRERLLDIKVKNAVLRNSHITVVDALGGEDASVEFTKVNGNIYPTSTGFTYRAAGRSHPVARISVSGEADGSEDAWTFSGSLSAENLDLKTLKPYLIKKYPGLEAEGTLDLDLAYSKGERGTVRGTLNYRDLSLFMPWAHEKELSSAKGEAGVDATWGKDDFLIALEEASISISGVEINGSLKTRGPKENPSFELKLKTPYMDYNTFKELFPLEKFSDKFAARVDGFKVARGLVRVDEVDIAASKEDLTKKGGLIVNAERSKVSLSLKEFRFNYPGFNETYSNVSGHVALSGTTLTTKRFSGLYGKAVIDSLNGEIRGLATGKSSYKFAFDGEFLAQESLQGLKEFSPALKPVEARGRIKMNVLLKGDPSSGRAYSGSFILKDIEMLRHSALPITFKSVSGKVDFSPRGITLSNIDATSEGSSIRAEGLIEKRAGKSNYDIVTRGTLSHRTLKRLLKKQNLKIPAYDRPFSFDLKVFGQSDSLEIDSTIDLTPTRLTYKKIAEKKSGMKLLVKSLIKIENDTAEIKRADIKIGSSKLHPSGYLSFDPPAYDIEISESSLEVKDLATILSKLDERDASGMLNLDLRARKEPGVKVASIEAEISLIDGRLKSSLLRSPLKDLTFTATLSRREAEIDLVNVAIGNSALNGRISITDIAEGTVEFDLTAPYFYLSDFQPVGTTGDVEAKKKTYLKGRGMLAASKGVVVNQPFEELTTDITINNEEILLNQLSFSTNGGSVTGKATYLRDPDSKELYRTDLKLTGLDVESLARRMGLEDRIITGKFDGEINLSRARGDGSRKELSGDISIEATGGKLWKFVIISKVFSIVNILHIDDLFKEGLPYKSARGDFKITEGVFETENIIFESDSLRMSSRGTIDSSDGELDMTLGFHPFVTVDKVISTIPLAGWIIGGDEKSAISMYYSIEGPIGDPEVTPQPIKTIGKKFLGIIGRTMEAPIKVVEPIGLSIEELKPKEKEETAEGEEGREAEKEDGTEEGSPSPEPEEE